MKANQGERHENIRDLFACGERTGWDGVAHSHHQQAGNDHGRLERRERWVITDPEELAYVDPKAQWASLSAVARVSYRRGAASGSPNGYPLLHLQLSGRRGHAPRDRQKPLEHRE